MMVAVLLGSKGFPKMIEVLNGVANAARRLGVGVGQNVSHCWINYVKELPA